MKKRKLTYQFHNPNTAEATADMLVKVLIEANAGKVERAIREAAGRCADEAECKEMNPAQVHNVNGIFKNKNYKAGYEIFSHIQPRKL